MIVRPERLAVARPGTSRGAAGTLSTLSIEGVVTTVMYLGDRLDLQVTVGPERRMMLSIRSGGECAAPAAGEAVTITTRSSDCWLLPRQDAGR